MTLKIATQAVLLSQRPIFRCFFLDLSWAFLCTPLALLLRLGTEGWPFSVFEIFLQSFSYALVTASVMLLTRSYKSIWRYVSVYDLWTISLTTLLTGVLFIPYLKLACFYAIFPVSALIVQGLLLACGWTFLRLAARAAFSFREENKDALPTLILGVNSQTELLIRQVLSFSYSPYKITGILEIEKNNMTRYLHGIPVLGALKDLHQILVFLRKKQALPKVVIAADSALSMTQMHALTKEALVWDIQVLSLPSMRGFGTFLSLKPQTFDITSILKRPEKKSDKLNARRAIQGQKVLITGGGGSIGQECVKQVAENCPKELVYIDNNEFSLYKTSLLMAKDFPHVKQKGLLLDIKNKEAVDLLMRAERPDFVFHAAALKHVPILENQPTEGVLTNLIGTMHVADACVASGVKNMVFISTDKAVNPKSWMGRTKKAAELYCQILDQKSKETGTNFSIVRFGNVLDSSGSVLPLFMQQIKQGGPVTVTHKEITRYFMTVPEAVHLIIQSLFLRNKNPELNGTIFTLDMGRPIAILELAETLIQLNGLTPYKDIAIQITGLRPGEKLHEELFTSVESEVKTEHPHIKRTVCRQNMLCNLYLERIYKIQKLMHQGDGKKCLDALQALVLKKETRAQEAVS